MSTSTIDSEIFKELQGSAGEDFVVELVDTFLADAPHMLSALRKSLAAGDADGFRRAAHSLKSNSHTFGAMTLGALARELEHGGLERARGLGAGGERALDAVDALDAIDAIDAEYERVAAALTQLNRSRGT